MATNRDQDFSVVRLLDVRQVAEALHVHVRTVWRMSAEAEAELSNFPRLIRLGPKTIRWRLSDLQRFLEAKS